MILSEAGPACITNSKAFEKKLSAKDRRWLIRAAVILIIIISCLPLALTYISYVPGHDLLFHLYRIDGIVQGLKDGQFPVAIQSSQINSFGYPVSVMYGDLFLYIPALLRFAGLSVKASYSVLVVLVNSFCAIITFYTFRKMFQSEMIGVAACALWTLSPYRLLDDVYLRSAVGEYLALDFFPVIAYGIFSIIFYGEGRSDLTKRGWIWCALGAVGIVYSHIISIVLAALLFVPLLIVGLICFPSAKKLLMIAQGLLLAGVLSLAFVVPFVDYYFNIDMKVSTISGVSKRILAADNAIQPAQLLFFSPTVASISLAGQTVAEMPFNIGWGIILTAFLSTVCSFLPSFRENNIRRVDLLLLFILFVAFAFAFASSAYFPWGKELHTVLDKLISFLATIQYPWRLLGPLTFSLLLVLGLALWLINRKQAFFISAGIIFVGILICLVEYGVGITSFLTNATPLPADYTEADYSGGVMNGEYLPADCDLAELLHADSEATVLSGDVNISSCERSGASITLLLESGNNGGSVLLPLLYYPNYEIVDNSSSELSISPDDNGRMLLDISQQYQGTVEIGYIIPIAWRLAQLISLIAFLLICFFGVKLFLRYINCRKSRDRERMLHLRRASIVEQK